MNKYWRNKLIAALMFMALTVTAAGCSSGSSAGGNSSGSQKPVVVLQATDPVTLDPCHSGSIVEANIFLHVMESLVGFDDSCNIIPSLATSWENPDPKTWIFKLRKDVKFQDGQPFTSADVKYSFDRGMDPATKTDGNFGWILASINVEKVEATDDYTVKLTTKDPCPALLTYLAEYYIMPKHYYEGKDQTFLQTNMMGTGPYKFVEWKKGEQIVLEANPDYWGGKPKIDKIVWKTVPEASSRIAELITGGADVIDKVPPDMESQIKGDAAMISCQSGKRIYIGFVQYGNPIVRDKRVRQAFNYAVDFDSIIKNLLGGVGQRVASFVNPPWSDTSLKPYPYDVNKAKALMQEAGYTDTNGDGTLEDKDGKPIKLILLSPKNKYLKDIEMCQVISSDLQKIGVQVEVKPMEWSTYVDEMNNFKLEGDMFLIGSGSSFEGQSDISDVTENNSSNYGQWKNDEFNSLYKQLGAEFKTDKRHELLNKMQQLMYDEAPMIFLYNQPDYYGVSKKLNWKPTPYGRIVLSKASLNQ